jgi:hypothetical protein
VLDDLLGKRRRRTGGEELLGTRREEVHKDEGDQHEDGEVQRVKEEGKDRQEKLVVVACKQSSRKDLREEAIRVQLVENGQLSFVSLSSFHPSRVRHVSSSRRLHLVREVSEPPFGRESCSSGSFVSWERRPQEEVVERFHQKCREGKL